MINKLPVILLVGGESSRFQNLFDQKPYPKSLNKINKKTLIEYVIKNFLDYNLSNFVLPLGHYQNDFINFFKKKKIIFGRKIVFFNNKKDYYKIHSFNNEIKIFLFNSGKYSNKAKRIKNTIYLFNLKNFIVSYGDGVGNVNLNKLYNQHIKSKSIITSAGYIPKSQYGHYFLKNKKVIDIIEKPLLNDWVIIGYIFCKFESIKYFNKEYKKDLEMGVMRSVCKNNKLSLFKHKGFWKSVDTKKDLLELLQYLKKIKI